DVERVEIVVVELVFNVHLERNRKPLLHIAHQDAVVLGSEPCLRRHGRIVDAAIATALNKYRAAGNAAGCLARSQQRQDALIKVEFVSLRRKGLLFRSLLATSNLRRGQHAATQLARQFGRYRRISPGTTLASLTTATTLLRIGQRLELLVAQTT